MSKPIPILLLEDDDVDARVLERALGRLPDEHILIRKRDGVEGLDYICSLSSPIVSFRPAHNLLYFLNHRSNLVGNHQEPLCRTLRLAFQTYTPTAPI